MPESLCGVFPDLGSPQVIQSLLQNTPGASKPRYLCPRDSSIYKGNPALTHVSYQQLPDPANTILLYENDKAHLDGCNVAFADGHIKWYKNSEWQMMKAQSSLR